MKNRTTDFLDEIEASIKVRIIIERGYRILHVGLGVIIASCGFLTAAASQNEMKTTWVSSPTSLLIFGLLSVICAIINQIMTPGEKYTHHLSVKRALQYIRGEVKFRNMTLKDAETLRALAIINPELVLGKLHDTLTGGTKL